MLQRDPPLPALFTNKVGVYFQRCDKLAAKTINYFEFLIKEIASSGRLLFPRHKQDYKGSGSVLCLGAVNLAAAKDSVCLNPARLLPQGQQRLIRAGRSGSLIDSELE